MNIVKISAPTAVFMVLCTCYANFIPDSSKEGRHLIELQAGSKAMVQLAYFPDENFFIHAQLDTGTTVPTDNMNVNHENMTLSFPLDSETLQEDGFGTYVLTVTLVYDNAEKISEDFVVFFEEAIAGLHINHYPFVQVGKEVNIEMKLDSGSNLFTEWFTDNMETFLLHHEGICRRYLRPHVFTVPGIHNCTVVAANSVSRMATTMPIHAINTIDGIQVRADRTQTVGKPVLVHFKMHRKETDLYLGNLRISVQFGDGNSLSEDISSCIHVLRQEGIQLAHTYMAGGKYNMVVQVYNEVDRKVFKSVVEVTDSSTISKERRISKVLSLETDVGGSTFVKLQEGSSASIVLLYEVLSTDSLFLHVELDTKAVLPSTSAVFDRKARTINFTVKDSDVTDGFGTYLVTFTLIADDGSSQSKDVILLYEEPIRGFTFDSPYFIPVGEETTFHASFTKGSNTETEWFFDTDETFLHQHPGRQKDIYINHIFTVPGVHKVIAVTQNSIKRTCFWKLVHALHKPSGFKLRCLERQRLIIHLQQHVNFHMGKIFLKIIYDSGTQFEFNVTPYIDKMRTYGHIIKVPHFKNTYSARGIIYNAVGSQNIDIKCIKNSPSYESHSHKESKMINFYTTIRCSIIAGLILVICIARVLSRCIA